MWLGIVQLQRGSYRKERGERTEADEHAILRHPNGAQPKVRQMKAQSERELCRHVTLLDCLAVSTKPSNQHSATHLAAPHTRGRSALRTKHAVRRLSR
eukprot:1631452-Pleurochrysis_carterae.AAC.1